MDAPELSQPHDSLIRHTFGQASHAASFFRENLSPAVAAEIKWEQLELVSGSFVDEELRRSESDLLYQVPLADGKSMLFLYLLFEHQSSLDRWMTLRLLSYMVQIWLRQIKARPIPESLSPIIPMVLSQVDGGWKISRKFEDLIEWPKSSTLRAHFQKLTPHFEHLLIDLAQLELDEVRGDTKMRLAVSLLKAACEGRIGEWFDWAIPLLRAVEKGENPEFLSTLFRYLANAERTVDFSELRAKLAKSALSDKTTATIMSIAEQLRSEGRQEGREEGRKEEVINQLQMLQRLTGRKMDLSSALEGRTLEQLRAEIDKLGQELKTRFK